METLEMLNLPEERDIMNLTFPRGSLGVGKSIRVCAPRLSLRSRAEYAIARLTSIKLIRSKQVCHPALYDCDPVANKLEALDRSCCNSFIPFSSRKTPKTS